MSENEVVIKDDTFDYEKLAAQMEARQEAKAAKEATRLSDLSEARAEGKEEGLTAKAEELKTWAEEKGSPLVMEESKPGGDHDGMDTFRYWMKTGDEVAARKALQEGDGAEGGYLVPDDFVAKITEKRDSASFVRAMGVQVIQTSRDAIDIPAESTSLTKFARTAEEVAYSTNDPSFAQNNVIIHKWTKLTKISEELLADDASNLEEFYATAVGRSMAQTEAYYVAIGSGSNQHLGIFTGGTTDSLTFDTAAHIEPVEIYELFTKLNTGYQANAAWLMDPATWQHLITLRNTSNWAFGAADYATINTMGGPQAGTLYGKPVFLQDDIPVIASDVCVVMVGDPTYYALVERQGLVVSRNPYLYQATGQVGFFNTFRQGGTVLVEEAWVGGLMA
jgi:HK97 family phage major capsid protein